MFLWTVNGFSSVRNVRCNVHGRYMAIVTPQGVKNMKFHVKYEKNPKT